MPTVLTKSADHALDPPADPHPTCPATQIIKALAAVTGPSYVQHNFVHLVVKVLHRCARDVSQNQLLQQAAAAQAAKRTNR